MGDTCLKCGGFNALHEPLEDGSALCPDDPIAAVGAARALIDSQPSKATEILSPPCAYCGSKLKPCDCPPDEDGPEGVAAGKRPEDLPPLAEGEEPQLATPETIESVEPIRTEGRWKVRAFDDATNDDRIVVIRSRPGEREKTDKDGQVRALQVLSRKRTMKKAAAASVGCSAKAYAKKVTKRRACSRCQQRKRCPFETAKGRKPLCEECAAGVS